jgi:hypothetical protein
LIWSCKKEDIVIDGIESFELYLEQEMKSQKIPAASVLVFKGEIII